MKAQYLLAAALTLSSLAGCNKTSDRYTGVEKQPAHPEERSPGTVPTTPSGGPAAPSTEESADTAPTEDPDTLGTTRTPATADQPTRPNAAPPTGSAPATK